MNKKGAELPMNFLVMAIIVIVALVVILVFFLGGTSSITTKIKNIFTSQVAGTDMTLAVQTCNQYCENAKLLPQDIQKNSAFCQYSFLIDKNGDGVAEKTKDGKDYKKFYCNKKTPNPDTEEILGITCTVECP